jgi:hypothetical protein
VCGADAYGAAGGAAAGAVPGAGAASVMPEDWAISS